MGICIITCRCAYIFAYLVQMPNIEAVENVETGCDHVVLLVKVMHSVVKNVVRALAPRRRL